MLSGSLVARFPSLGSSAGGCPVRGNGLPDSLLGADLYTDA